jgi:hypothetical protein
MLDIDHPDSQPIFEAAAYMDRIIRGLRVLTVGRSPEERAAISESLVEQFEKLERLGAGHFPESIAIPSDLRILADQSRSVADFPVNDDEATLCPACGRRTTSFAGIDGTETFCASCFERFVPVLERLQSDEGFKTCFI